MRLTIVLLCGLVLATPRQQAGNDADLPSLLGAPQRVTAGVDLFRIDGPVDLAEPGGGLPSGGVPADRTPRSIRLLRLDPRRVRLASALATGEVPGRAPVLDIARRAKAIAAVNGGFFSPTGDPNGLLKIDGRLLSDTGRARGAVAIIEAADRFGGLFDQVSARVHLRFRAAKQWRTVPIDGVDTTRGRGRLVLYTPASGASTDTAGGLEWTLRTRGSTLRVVDAGRGASSTSGDGTIPRDGYVLSYGGSTVPDALAGIERASSIQVREALQVGSGTRGRDWARATTIVGGAGLLVRRGRPLTDWAVEQLSAGFETTPHPRTVIAVDSKGLWWLITIDGRQPGRATGMSFLEMQTLLRRLDVTDALNLDGGGSTTMVVGDAVVNRPSDPTGPRAVSDAILVIAPLL